MTAAFPHLERRRAYLDEYANNARLMARRTDLPGAARAEALNLADERSSFANAIDQELSYGSPAVLR